MNIIKGRVWKFGDNINTDNMSPGQLVALGIKICAQHCLEAIRPEFPKQVKPGDVVVAGTNFGTGSSRATAPLALKELGVALIVAKSFARIFYRNAIDLALPVVICPEAYEQTDDGDLISVDLVKGEVTNETKGRHFAMDPIPQTMMDIMEAGGIINYVVEGGTRA